MAQVLAMTAATAAAGLGAHGLQIQSFTVLLGVDEVMTVSAAGSGHVCHLT